MRRSLAATSLSRAGWAAQSLEFATVAPSDEGANVALVRHFEADKAYAGLLIDGVAGTPYVVATLTLTAGNGLLVEVPYATVKNAAQFQTVDRWFESREIPEAFQFRGDEIEVTLYGCRMSGRTRHFGRQLAVGRFVAQHAVLGLREVSESFDVLTVRSRLVSSAVNSLQ